MHARPGQRWRLTAALMMGAGYAVLASFTHPFTRAADLVTAVGAALVVMAAVVGARWTRNRLVGSPEPSAVGRAIGSPRTPRSFMWTASALAAVGWELFCLSQLPRAQHPTLSTLIDSLDATRVGKTVAFGAWLALGFFLATP